MYIKNLFDFKNQSFEQLLKLIEEVNYEVLHYGWRAFDYTFFTSLEEVIITIKNFPNWNEEKYKLINLLF